MTENLLQFIWQYRLYQSAKPLLTNDLDEIIVLHPGQLNTNAGPDFLEAKIKIGNTIWAGNVEIHLLSSDWRKHKHPQDANYDKLILHVVYKDDAPVNTLNNSVFPTLVLFPYIQPEMLVRYEKLMSSQAVISCMPLFKRVKPLTVEMQMQRMLAERLEEKITHLQHLLVRFRNNWQEVFYIQLARFFGSHINQEAFESLAILTPLPLLAKYRHNELQIEALLFGQAGMLDDYFDEAYPLQLQNEYRYLRKLHQLTPVKKHLWKFLRLRPANFPTIRIAQFAQLLIKSSQLFSKVTTSNNIKDLESLFALEVSAFWRTHYTFHESSSERSKHPGKNFISTLIINAIVPLLFIYGKMQGNRAYCDLATDYLHALPAEKNKMLNLWDACHVSTKSAADSQSLLQLYKNYCTNKRCLECAIGFELLKPVSTTTH